MPVAMPNDESTRSAFFQHFWRERFGYYSQIDDPKMNRGATLLKEGPSCKGLHQPFLRTHYTYGTNADLFFPVKSPKLRVR
jgi:hypothetical protein